MKTPAAALALLLSTVTARAEGLAPTLSDWGTAGLLQTPTARALPDGTVTGTFTLLGDLHRHIAVGAQLLPNLEVTLRNTLYPNWYGISDPGVDAKLRLLREGEWWPALAVGGRDVTGSGFDLPGKGRFAGEYLVASRRWWNLDLSLGLGWGGLGDYGHFKNPLRFLGGRFQRDRDPTQPGARGPRAWFTGDRTALFGGVEWHSPVEGLSVKLEYSGDSFRAQQQEDPLFQPGLPVNAGLAYRPLPWVELGAGVEQGKRAMLRLTARFDPGEKSEETATTPPPAVGPRPPRESALPAEDVATLARAHGLPARSALVAGDRAALWLDPAGTGTMPLAQEAGRAARLLADAVPAEVEQLTIATGNAGLEGAAVTLLRRDVERAANKRGSAEEIWHTAQVAPTAGPAPDWPMRWSLTLHPTAEISLFEQGAPFVQRTFTDAVLMTEPARGLVLGTGLRANLSGNLSLLDTNAVPAEQPVRSDLPLYAAQRLELEHLYAAWLANPAPGWATRLSIGQFEEMFGGIGGEALYHPLEARWAAGLDLNRVWKRPPGDPLRLAPDSGRTTGHASLYWEAPGAATTTALRVGRYLGGDWGGTLELMRAFDGGVRLSAHLTWTEGPDGGQSRFGGRLEQGLSLVVPFGPSGSIPVGGTTDVTVGTLGRDAGQRLRQPLPLYETTVPAGFGRLAGTWSHLMD
ncbi:YjbH domain-containing protein [Azospirillum sp. sgz302134]